MQGTVLPACELVEDGGLAGELGVGIYSQAGLSQASSPPGHAVICPLCRRVVCTPAAVCRAAGTWLSLRGEPPVSAL